jgi:hypothetical protein
LFLLLSPSRHHIGGAKLLALESQDAAKNIPLDAILIPEKNGPTKLHALLNLSAHFSFQSSKAASDCFFFNQV